MIVPHIFCNLCQNQILSDTLGNADCKSFRIVLPTSQPHCRFVLNKPRDAQIHICLDCWQGIRDHLNESTP